MWIDHWVAACLVPLAFWILLSGLDDLFIDLVYWLMGKKQPGSPAGAELDGVSERRIAILVPLWREDRVIAPMLRRNLSTLRYANYDVFVGVYPNDEGTAAAVAGVARDHPSVHMAVCPHDGPTSKGDCLNHAYAAMREREHAHGVRYRVVVTHDAEDLIHPDSLRLINWFSRRYQMVQVPVLPLPTAAREFTHGVYCDEFAEYQSKDIPVRRRLGGFLPSNGVGTGYARPALERLARERQGRPFDPECLTEDYETGYRLHALGFSQVFVPVRFDASGPVATREYFPRNFRAAIRQRGRWVAGIALQGWERHGWRTSWRQRYWFWRDRKGLMGNLLSPLANVLFLYGLASCLAAAGNGAVWHLGTCIPHWLRWTSGSTLVLSALQTGVRVATSARTYGLRFAAAAPLRMPWANIVNCAATLEGLRQFFGARSRRGALVWIKTEHIYPAQTGETG
ncbi:MAG: glycosyl transferase family protein [Acidobacteriia bacterium]|nr:glycosyl transferase family protein [Terriglobia bacterium]